MKRIGNLFPQICSWSNLELAARRARKRKRYRYYTEQFELRRESILRDIRSELLAGEWQPQPYHEFMIFDPKERLICAAPYRDRVVHHAICNVIDPILERRMVDQSYSCRTGKGTGAARQACLRMVRKYRYVLKLDVRKYFPSVDHRLLKEKIRRVIKCADTLTVIDRIIASWRTDEGGPAWFAGGGLLEAAERPRGIPIGNLTSQLFANFFLNRLDHFILQELKPKGFIRYTDDLLLFSNSKAFLHDSLARLSRELEDDRLKPHPKKCRVMPVRAGVPFLGFRFFPGRVRVLRENRRRFEKRMNRLRRGIARGRNDISEIWPSMFGWFQFVREYPVNEGLVLSECRRQVF